MGRYSLKKDFNSSFLQQATIKSKQLQQRNTELENEVIAGTAQLQEQLKRDRLIFRQSLFLYETLNATAIVKNALDLHCGSISVESKVNVGTTFKVCIPTIQIKNESQ